MGGIHAAAPDPGLLRALRAAELRHEKNATGRYRSAANASTGRETVMDTG